MLGSFQDDKMNELPVFAACGLVDIKSFRTGITNSLAGQVNIGDGCGNYAFSLPKFFLSLPIAGATVVVLLEDQSARGYGESLQQQEALIVAERSVDRRDLKRGLNEKMIMKWAAEVMFFLDSLRPLPKACISHHRRTLPTGPPFKSPRIWH
ncbi:hypothetical protein L3Q82_004636 [Scortum barcoo]|uniref:Uncharacterized protein n=1 Tax=Scortum barcoo TaxID=214431 RepID=A0ACB8VGP9_9TELE|nr:hypothetical protein L3Q82_004636 [Scortum barcoo]